MPIVIPASPGATSTAQTLPALQVFDYLYMAGDSTATSPKPLPNAEIRITLQHDRATTQSPIVYVAPRTIVTSTDRNGYWSAYLVANDALSPLNTVYTVQTPHSVYQISVPSGGGPYKSSTILANAVSNLPPATTNVIGPLTVTGNETVTGNLTVGGNTSLGATTVGALTAAAGIFSGDLTIASAFRLLFGAAVAKIIGGATSLSLRNNADTQDNVLVTDAGGVTVRNGLTVSAGAIALPAASVADAALSSNVPLKNAANTFSAAQTINSTLTLNNAISLPPSAAGTVAPSSYGSVPVKIAESVLGGSAASVTFASIPAGFRHLLIEYAARSDQAAAQAVLVQFNGDAAANYDYEVAQWTNTAASVVQGFAAQTSGRCGAASASGAAAGMFQTGVIDLPHYANTSLRKTWVSRGGRFDADAAANATWENEFGQWRSTAAINQIVLLPGVGNLVANSIFTLYGIP